MLCPTKHKMMKRFIRGLALLLYLVLEHLISVRYTFLEVIDHARTTERA